MTASYLADTDLSEDKVHFWQGPFFKPVLGLFLVFVLLIADEVVGCVGGAGCWIGVLSLAGVATVALGFVLWSRRDPEHRRSWALLIMLAGLIVAVLGVTTGPTIKVVPVIGSGKISPEIDRTAEKVDIIVDLKFEPQQFHRETIAGLGVFSGTDRDDRSKLRLLAVPQDNLSEIANLFWVDEITPFQR